MLGPPSCLRVKDVVLTEAVCVLSPVLSEWSLRSCGVAFDVVEVPALNQMVKRDEATLLDEMNIHVRPIHNIQTPQRRLPHEEIVDCDLGNIPKHKRHRSSRLRNTSLRSVPDVAIPVDPSRPIPVNSNPVAGQDEGSGVVLEGDRVVVQHLSPIVDVGTHGPCATPFDGDVLYNWIQFGGDVVVFTIWKDDLAIVTAHRECLEDVGDVTGVAAVRVDCAFFASGEVLDLDVAAAVVRGC